ncbi:hypothetical protein PISMIDRAFT_678490 [Pisolithus microcarpus 441]|uniref:Selenoprotein O n=1 Tax=Pisolithus microcarpus 441 TaxID=765257 RepID=A0A0C9ZDM9_9AGAM|nr:hypothetical protein BKA83DRAFT_678490 [Pisolithus microcarpus]KIK24009.1 hypothetical protein PISMIDRAFT_678490 [Pisolithus microcarpus 441]
MPTTRLSESLESGLSSAFSSAIMSFSMPVMLGERSWSSKWPEEMPRWLQHGRRTDSYTASSIRTISIAGLTIDYDRMHSWTFFDPHHICNHSDQEGRYAYNQQPNMILYARRALLDALTPLIGAGIALRNKGVQRGWADNVSDETISKWRAAGIKEVGSTMNQVTESTCASEYGIALHRGLALRHVDPSDQPTIFQPLLDMMENHRLGFHVTFRKLAFFRLRILRGEVDSGATALEGFIAELLGGTPEPERLDAGRATEEWLAWLDTYAARIDSEKTSGE